MHQQKQYFTVKAMTIGVALRLRTWQGDDNITQQQLFTGHGDDLFIRFKHRKAQHIRGAIDATMGAVDVLNVVVIHKGHSDYGCLIDCHLLIIAR